MRRQLLPVWLLVAGVLAGCGGSASSGPPQSAARPSVTPTRPLPGGHLDKYPTAVRRLRHIPTARPGVTAVVPTVSIATVTRYVWPARTYRATIFGTVTDAATHRPIAGATISIDNGQRMAKTGPRGTYHVKFPVGGSIPLVVSASGYMSTPGIGKLNAGKAYRANFRLRRAHKKGDEPPPFPVIIGRP